MLWFYGGLQTYALLLMMMMTMMMKSLFLTLLCTLCCRCRNYLWQDGVGQRYLSRENVEFTVYFVIDNNYYRLWRHPWVVGMPPSRQSSQLSSHLAVLQVAAAAAAAATLWTSFNELQSRRRISTTNAESISELLAPAVTSQITWYNCRTALDTVM